MDRNAEHLTLIDDCEARESRLTDWERNFIDSLRAHLNDGKALSIRQSDSLDDIWERVTAKG